MGGKITPILLPKWGMDMEEGRIGEWLVSEGDRVTAGEDILEIESEKVTNVLETSGDGVLKRKLVNAGEIHPVGMLLGVVADEDVSGKELSDFIARFQPDIATVQSSDAPASRRTDEVIEINGQRLHYTSLGEDDLTVVLVHGFGGSLSSWGGLQEALAVSYRVIGVELPGHGSSSKQVSDAGSKDFAKLLLSFLDKLNIENAHLVGHSLGGTIITQLASLAPSRARSLSLISNYGTGTEVDIEYIEEFVTASRRKNVKAVLKRLFLDSSFVNSEMVENMLKQKRLEGAGQALRMIADKIREEQPAQAIIHLPAVPTQIIIGRKDTIITADETLLANVDNLSIIDDAGHMPQLEKAAQTVRLVKEFLKTQREDPNADLAGRDTNGL
ncbi:hypothetical protein MNBD_ALPHA04-1261 [hydrothermal vent metagenome]|uniref:Lipoyl-binding domain-containing protein n=1 Tax=hydrothermal vent metagenome TaxID=652676 RepID=A0A3B0RTV7_9ZZZZ